MIRNINKSNINTNSMEIFRWIQTNNYLEVENYVKKNLLDLNNTYDKEENNLLSFAVQSGYFEICDLLIKNGLPINTRNVRLKYLYNNNVIFLIEIWKHAFALCNRLQTC